MTKESARGIVREKTIAFVCIPRLVSSRWSGWCWMAWCCSPAGRIGSGGRHGRRHWLQCCVQKTGCSIGCKAGLLRRVPAWRTAYTILCILFSAQIPLSFPTVLFSMPLWLWLFCLSLFPFTTETETFTPYSSSKSLTTTSASLCFL